MLLGRKNVCGGMLKFTGSCLVKILRTLLFWTYTKNKGRDVVWACGSLLFIYHNNQDHYKLTKCLCVLQVSNAFEGADTAQTSGEQSGKRGNRYGRLKMYSLYTDKCVPATKY